MAKYTGNAVVDHIIQKLKDNKDVMFEIKKMMQQTSSSIYMDAQSSPTFCHQFKIPRQLVNALLKVYGVTEPQLQAAFKEFNMHTNRMYEDIYYQVFLVAYTAGVYLKDDQLRKLSLFMILIKLYNGMMYKFFRYGCKPEVATFILRNMRNSAIFKKHATPIEAIGYFIDTLESKYMDEVRSNPKEKIVRLFSQAWGRLFQVFQQIAERYYKAVKEGQSDTQIKTIAQNENKGQEALTLPESEITLIVDKYKKASSIKPVKIPAPEIDKLASITMVTKQSIEKVESYIDNPANQLEISYLVAYILNALKISKEKELASVPVTNTVDKLMSRRGDVNIQRLKESVDTILGKIFGAGLVAKLSTTQKLKLRKMFVMILFYKIKQIVSKNAKFERSVV